MNTWAHIISGLKGTFATPWRSCARIPELLLFWLTLKRLTTALDTLFTAWREGTLPPPPAPAATRAAPKPPCPAANTPHRATPRIRKSQARPAQARMRPAPGILLPAAPRVPPAAAPSPADPPGTPSTAQTGQSHFLDILETMHLHALFVTITEQYILPACNPQKNPQTSAHEHVLPRHSILVPSV